MDTLATHVSACLRATRQAYLTAKARLTGKGFFCVALAGTSEMNVAINCDLTVSCTCHDVDGLGRIGDLKHESLPEIFAGNTAARFRQTLADGRLPIADCARCSDLRMVPRDKARQMAAHHRLPSFVMVENTSACNLRCASCPRERIRKIRSQHAMSLDDVRRVAGELRDAGVRKVGYLNFGEPFLSKHIREELEILRQTVPDLWIGTSTNAMALDTDEKREAALLLDRMQISLDGIDQAMVEKYQRGADFQRAYRNMKALVDYRDARGASRPGIIWKYLLFRWTERKTYLKQAIELAREAHVDGIYFERTVSPFYGIPIRSYLGWNDDIGEACDGNRLVALRARPSGTEHAGQELEHAAQA